MKKAERVALLCAAALLGVFCLAGRATGQELSAEAKDKAAAEARAFADKERDHGRRLRQHAAVGSSAEAADG